MTSSIHNIYFGFGISCYLVASFFIIGNHVPFIMAPMMIGIGISITFVSHLFYLNEFAKRKITGIEQEFGSILLFGFLALFVAGLPTLLSYTDIDLRKMAKTRKMIDMTLIYCGMLFFVQGLVVYRKLMFKRKNNSVIQRWNLLVTFLVISNFTLLQDPISIPNFFSDICLWAGILIILPLLLRIKWIALLDRRTQWLCIFFLLAIISISLVVMQGIYNIDTKYVILKPITRNVFLVLVSFCVLMYSTLSLIALLFNLPIFSVIEEKEMEIKSYQEISTAITSKESSKETLQRLFNICYTNTMSNAGWLVLHETDEETQTVKQSHENITNISEEVIKALNKSVNFTTLASRPPSNGYYYFPNLVRNKVFKDKNTKFKSLLILPIFASNKLKGAVCLISNMYEGFDEYMISLTKSYVDQTNLALENTRLLEESIKAARYKEELEIAHNLQQALLPQPFLDNEFCEVAVFCESAKEVGGDYYDFNKIDDYRMAFIIGDVSGKGTSAAFHMAQFKGIFQSLIQLCLPADNFMMMANTAAANCLEIGRFVTLIYLSIDLMENTFTFSRAGHCPLLYFDAETQTSEYLSKGGLGLGIVRDQRFANFVEAETRPLHVDDIIVLYTDGITEGRRNNSEEEYGYDRMNDCLLKNANQDAETIKNALVNNFKAFTLGSDYRDDSSMLVIKIKKLDKTMEVFFP